MQSDNIPYKIQPLEMPLSNSAIASLLRYRIVPAFPHKMCHNTKYIFIPDTILLCCISLETFHDKTGCSIASYKSIEGGITCLNRNVLSCRFMRDKSIFQFYNNHFLIVFYITIIPPFNVFHNTFYFKK